ncbi:transcriptional repressor [Selenomonadales bacterium OttesenSCG-928-I06]|nr:transcriptional repressor [Selenomonadales bacterium OttesenSCG-928-I06]
MKKNVTTLLRDKGFKVTPQRIAIYNALLSTKEHPKAETIYNKLLPLYPTMSLATVYKTLETLSNLNLIQVLNLGEDSFRYDADMSTHHHIRCLKCDKVEDLHGIDAQTFINEVTDKTNYTLQRQQFYFFGVCPNCQKSH